MKIVLPSSPERFGFPFRIVGNAGRYDTVSDCEFLDESHIVSCDRQSAQLYLIEFDLAKNTHTILDSTTVICNDQPQHFELLSFRQTPTEITVYSISYRNTLFSCNIVNNKFCNFRTVVVNPGEAYHGVLAFGANSVYLTNMLKPSITEFNIKTVTKRTIVCNGGVRMKDVAILDSDHIIAISSDRGPINGTLQSDGTVTPQNPPYDSHALIYNRHTGALIARHILEGTQVDGCIYHAPFCYVTCTRIDGSGYILRSKINAAYEFTEIIHIPCAGFPHGLAIYKHLFAYTSYSESAIYIDEYDTFLNLAKN